VNRCKLLNTNRFPRSHNTNDATYMQSRNTTACIDKGNAKHECVASKTWYHINNMLQKNITYPAFKRAGTLFSWGTFEIYLVTSSGALCFTQTSMNGKYPIGDFFDLEKLSNSVKLPCSANACMRSHHHLHKYEWSFSRKATVWENS